MAAIAALSEARTAMVAGHAELAEVQLRLGIRTRMDGIEDKVEPDQRPSCGKSPNFLRGCDRLTVLRL